MGDLTDTDLIEIVATALHRSGPSLNPERIDMMHARLRANAVVQELKRHKLVVHRDGCAPPASPETEKPAA